MTISNYTILFNTHFSEFQPDQVHLVPVPVLACFVLQETILLQAQFPNCLQVLILLQVHHQDRVPDPLKFNEIYTCPYGYSPVLEGYFYCLTFRVPCCPSPPPPRLSPVPVLVCPKLNPPPSCNPVEDCWPPSDNPPRPPRERKLTQ